MHILLSHFLAGISRSPALVIAYIMRYLSLPADDAYQYVKQRRSRISPNFNFLGQLFEYEQQLSLRPESTSNIIPIVQCFAIETPLDDYRRFIQIEGCSNTDNSMKYETDHVSQSPCYNVDLINTSELHMLLSPSSSSPSSSSSSSSMLNLQGELPERKNLLRQKLLRPKTISLKSSTIKVKCSASGFWSDNLTNRHERIETVPRNSETSPTSNEQADLINTYFQKSTTFSKSSEQ